MASQTTPAAFAEQWKQKTYLDDLPKDIDPFRELLEKWSGIPPDEHDELLYKIRDEAWEIHKFPCIGRWFFVNLSTTQHPIFQEVIARLKAPGSTERFIDVGCGMGQIQRQLAYQGIPTKMVYGVDLSREFINLGYKLFQDEEKWPKGRFYVTDVLQPSETALEWLRSKFTVVHASNLFHLFDRDEQRELATRLVEYVRGDFQDVLIFGGMIGKLEPDEIRSRRKVFLHDEASFQRLWDEVGEATGTKWTVAARFVKDKSPDIPGFPEDCRYIAFKITRG